MLFISYRSAFRTLVRHVRPPSRHLSTAAAAANMSTATADSPPKKPKTTPKTIGTHDGIFHCDEILACFMLHQLPEYAGAAVLRTRDPALLRDCDIVVDVGATYEPSALRFDHHQATFKDTFGSVRPELCPADRFRAVRLSSAGLIYAHYGEAVIRTILAAKCPQLELNAADLRHIYVKFYAGFVQEIDGIDNGVPQFDGEPLYRVSTDLSSRVAAFNAPWNGDAAAFDALAQFARAEKLAGAEFIDRVVYLASSWWPARRIVEEAVSGRFEVHASGAILELKQFAPWKEHLYELEQEQKDLAGVPIYVLMENKPGDYRVIGVPLNPKSFVCRRFLAKSWRGQRDEQLSEVSGIEGATFVHATGFIGGAKTREAALQMAIKSLESVEVE